MPSGEGGADATSEAEAESDSGDGDGEGGELGPTFWQDVAPIYYERCVSCHSEGGIGPFSLDSYGAASASASLCAEAVAARTMPPWLVVDDGSCNSWQDSLALSEDEIQTILDWVDAGTPEGEPRDDLAVPERPTLEGGIQMATPEFAPEPEGGLLTQNDEYRCFLLDPGLVADGFVTASEVVPGNAALVHHVLGVVVDPEGDNGEGITNLEAMQALDAESPDRAGWPCLTLFGEGINPKGIPIVWAPGQGVSELPDGTGMAIDAGDLIVAQIHYSMADPTLIGQTDSSVLGLRVEDSVDRRGFFDISLGLLSTVLSGNPETIPPGEEAYAFTYTVPLSGYVNGIGGGEPIELWGYFPHAHERGVSMSTRILDAQGQEKSCVGEVPRWDFDWQLYYYMEEPVMIEAGDQLEMTCVYDTSEDAQPIIPGWGTQNEMCFLGLYLSQAAG